MCSKLETDREKLRLNAGQGTQIEATEQHTISNKNHLGDFEKVLTIFMRTNRCSYNYNYVSSLQ